MADNANKAVRSAEKKVEKTTSLFDTAKDKLIKWEDKVKEHEIEIREACEKIQEIKEDLDDPCLDKCGEGWYTVSFSSVPRGFVATLLTDMYPGKHLDEMHTVNPVYKNLQLRALPDSVLREQSFLILGTRVKDF